jgi:hypothetical protein
VQPNDYPKEHVPTYCDVLFLYDVQCEDSDVFSFNAPHAFARHPSHLSTGLVLERVTTLRQWIVDSVLNAYISECKGDIDATRMCASRRS